MVDVSEILKDNRKETDTWMQNTLSGLFVLSVNKPVVSRVPLLVYKATRGNDPSLLSISHSDRWSSPPIDNDKDDHSEILFSLRLGSFLGCRYPPAVPVGPRRHVASTSCASNGAGTMVSLGSVHLLAGPFKHL